MGKKIVICGFSNSGKDSVAREIESKFNYNFIVSTTTRPMRVGECQGNPYNFISNSKFELLIENNSLVEHRAYDTIVDGKPSRWYYGVEDNAIEDNKDYVVVLDMIGLREFQKHFGEEVVSFFLDVDEEVRRNRCLKRGDFDKQEWQRRLEDDIKRFSYSVILEEVDFIVKNDCVKETALDIMEKIERINNNG